MIDPAAFGGLDAFLRQTGWLETAVASNPVRPGASSPRLPGARGLELRDRMRAGGVQLYPGVIDALNGWADRLGADRFGAGVGAQLGD